ncbi:uncharacterized protein PV09_03824 [Verruconis gallopava]|uniref:ABM domain-containing protein n=1 Tax=Verruconis gallopava TaxID=253628 RepID=A0A0D2B1U7_9PEZI|nr:uncharacterized protein PV09_03824 [Verruconis gallopava]KIW05299.1 hypothetical protein PV09_03824 [Verruconis gallopava]
MSPVLLFGILPAANEKARDEIIAGLGKIAEYAKEHDPETTKHATHVSVDPSDPLTVVAIEEYTSQAVCDAHNAWPPVLEFLEAWKADPGRLSGPPKIWHSNHAVASFTRDALVEAENPFVVLATLQYNSEEEMNDALSGWGPAVSATETSEQGTLSYAIGRDVEVQNRLTFVEVYEDKKYLEDVHMQSDILKKQMEAEKQRAPKMEIYMLKKVAGYLRK